MSACRSPSSQSKPKDVNRLTTASKLSATKRSSCSRPHARRGLPTGQARTGAGVESARVGLRTDVLDLWVFVKTDDDVARYLLLYTSEEKADRFFGGGRFWQIPGAFLQGGEEVLAALTRVLADLGLEAEHIWAVEHTYLIFNRRFQSLVAIPVFATEVREQGAPRLDWEHSEYGWFSAEECYDRLSFRGLREGLDWTRREISERSSARPEFRLA